MTKDELMIMKIESYIQGIKDTFNVIEIQVKCTIEAMENRIEEIKGNKNDN